jgi:adhesin transport system outer membrane protein
MQSLAQRDEAQAAYRGARAARLPTVSLGAEVDTDMRDPFAQRNDVSIGITVSSSLYQGGARKAREQASFYALQSANSAMAAARLEARRTLAEGQEQISNLRERIDAIGRRRASMQETGMLYRLQYFELGTRTLLDLLNAQQELHQTRFEEVNAEHDMRRLNVECLYSSGALRDAYALTGTVVRGVTL